MQIVFFVYEVVYWQIFSFGLLNFCLVCIFVGSIGMSYLWWDLKYIKYYGNFNQVGKDLDIEVDMILFFEMDVVQLKGLVWFIICKQGWFFFFLFIFEGFNFYYIGFKYLLMMLNVKGCWIEFGIIVLCFVIFLVFVFFMFLFGMVFVFFGVQFVVFGVYMGVFFVLNYKGMFIIDLSVCFDFFIKQVCIFCNICGGWWVIWLMGGLNYQVEYYFFLSMLWLYLLKVCEIVCDYCVVNNVLYIEISFGWLYLIVIEYLNWVGFFVGVDLFDCFVLVQFGWV